MFMLSNGPDRKCWLSTQTLNFINQTVWNPPWGQKLMRTHFLFLFVCFLISWEEKQAPLFPPISCELFLLCFLKSSCPLQLSLLWRHESFKSHLRPETSDWNHVNNTNNTNNTTQSDRRRTVRLQRATLTCEINTHSGENSFNLTGTRSLVIKQTGSQRFPNRKHKLLVEVSIRNVKVNKNSLSESFLKKNSWILSEKLEFQQTLQSVVSLRWRREDF